jgi:hypothetical protein
MVTLEQKIDIILEYIANDDPDCDEEIRLKAKEALGQPFGEADGRVDVSLDANDMIFDLFKELGVPPNLYGYNYAFMAVKLVLDDPSRINAIVKRVYTDIAVEYNTTTIRAERCIRAAIEAVFNRADFDIVSDVFGNIVSVKNGKLTNGEFIAACANEITRRMKRMQKSLI